MERIGRSAAVVRPSQRVGERRLAGFTLMELLAAVAIIALLAGLLLPALSAARARARESTCISQLHQIGKAFRMYEDDYQARPPHLYELWPQYVSDKRIFVCPDDAWVSRGGWAWSAWGRETTPPEHWPITISYGYFFSKYLTDPSWEAAQAAPGRPGYVVCVLHGRPDGESFGGTAEAPAFEGRTLRLCFDGGVIGREVRYEGHETFNTWKVMTDQEKRPGAPGDDRSGAAAHAALRASTTGGG